MKLLLDIDDTLIDSNEKLHPRAFYLFNHFDVTLYSASQDIEKWANKFNVAFISKHDQVRPKADVLIDDDPYFQKMVDVKLYCSSIDEFLNNMAQW